MYNVVTSIEIEGSSAQVWRALTDFSSYPRWNPSIRSIEGFAAEGQILKVLFQPDGAMAMKFRAIVLAVVAEKEFRWVGRLLFSGLFAGEHYFLIESVTSDRVMLIQGEHFSGLLAPLLFWVLEKLNKAGFVAMNQALKAYVESGSKPRVAVKP